METAEQVTEQFDAMLRVELERRLKICAARFVGRRSTARLRRQMHEAFCQECREFERMIVNELGMA